MAAPPIRAGRVHRFWLIKTKSPETCSISGKMYVVARMKPPKNVKAPAMVRAMPAALVDRISITRQVSQTVHAEETYDSDFRKHIKSSARCGPPIMLLVKLGGSVLTDKGRLRSPRRTAIRRLARELAAARAPLLVVHGAGSYGHILARKHRLNEGGATRAKRGAAARVQADVKALDGLVVDALIAAGLAAVPIPPSAVLSLDDGRVSSIDLTPFLEFSSMSFTPVTFGDVVRDLRRGFSICSGDLLMLELARAFRPERALFVADVDGLFTADPKTHKSARLLEAVKPSDLPQVKFRAASRTDVTGSIEGKVRRMFEIADHVGECWIVNGNVKNRVRDALRGRQVVGTRVSRGP